MSATRRLAIDANVAIIGSGFAGSLMALILRRLGRSVALLERGRHPRFVIGESSTPLANLLIEELSDRYALDRVRPLSKWGTWQRTYPHVGCGLKRGFSFFRHDPGEPFTDEGAHERQLLVAASPHDEIADTHWYRPDFDALLVNEAREAGATYVDELALSRMSDDGSGMTLLEGVRHRRDVRVRTGFVIDASGTRGFLHQHLAIPEQPLRWLRPTSAIYTHFEGVGTFDRTPGAGFEEIPPFPIDSAALHHVFPGGWIWVLRFVNGITSAGAALTQPLASEVRVAEPGAWDRLLQRLPSVAAQFAGSRPTQPFVYTPRLSFRSTHAVGPSWALLPSAAGVIDPLLSTGFPLTLLGVQRLARLFEAHAPGDESFQRGLTRYERQTLHELDATERLVAALYASMTDFDRFKRLALLYFAAASYAETFRRLGRPDRAAGFLLCDDERFGPELVACTERALEPLDPSAREVLFARIDAAIAPYDVAGLRDGSRRDWYPVLASDLLAAAPRLGIDREDAQRLLERAGFTVTTSQAAHPVASTEVGA
jgi:tetracycline 7-halogenase / FADH2 O2-dependent halogenase